MGKRIILDYEYNENIPMVTVKLPCGHNIDNINNETVFNILQLLNEIKAELLTIKRQISAHDYNIMEKLKGWEKE